MQFCDVHWQKLRAAIDARGLSDYVPANGTEAADKMRDATTRGEFTAANFDPLMGAHNTIVRNALNLAGLAVLQHDGCPICYLTEEHARTCTTPNCAQDFERWIDYAADGAKELIEQLWGDVKSC